MLPEVRQAHILQHLKQEGAVRVAELAEVLRASVATIRRDLEKLEQRGLLQRTHGGAVSVENRSGFEPPYHAQAISCVQEKRLIGALAASLIKDGCAVFIEAGTTCLEVARQLRTRRDLLVVTNGLMIAQELAQAPGITLVITGGELRKRTLALVGPAATAFLSEVHVDWAVLGVSGITPQGMTTASLAEAQVKRSIIAAASQVIGVADHTKFGKVAFASVAPVTALTYLITDEDELTKPDVTAIREQGVQVLVASPQSVPAAHLVERKG